MGKLNQRQTWLLLMLFACGLSLMMAAGAVAVHWAMPLSWVGLLVAAPAGVALIKSEYFGVYLMTGIACFMNMFLKLIPNLPIGLLMDFCILLMVLSMLYRCYWENSWKATFGTPLTLAIVVWIGWHLLQFGNPIAASRAAWFYVMRPAVGYTLLFFVAWRCLGDLQKIKNMFWVLVVLTFISAAWGVSQFVFGYFPFEMNYIVSHDAVHLVYIQGRWRSFGTMSSPSHFGVIMAGMTVVCWLLMGLRFSAWKKTLMLLTSMLALAGLVYSGARSGFAVFPLALAVVVGLSFNIRLYALSAVAGMLLAVLMVTPSNNYHIQRLQSTFKAEEDLSYQVREKNKEMIMPWILAHPMGGGLGSTGVWGQRFSPGTFLANFPPDSGYVRVSVEMGWIGFLLYIFLWGTVLWHSLKGFIFLKKNYRHKPEEAAERRVLALAMLALVVPLTVVETVQDIVGKLPVNLLFWVWMAMLLRITEAPAKDKNRA